MNNPMKNLGRTQKLVLLLLAEEAKDCRRLAYDWPNLSESAAYSAVQRLAERGLVDMAGWKENRRTYCLTRRGQEVEQTLLEE
jgi:DNA-binding PadR family transcriptional regulator